MIEVQDLRTVIELLDEQIATLFDLKHSLIFKENDLQKRLGENQTEEPKLAKFNFEKAKVIESLAYNIIGCGDRKFLNDLITLMKTYSL